MVWRDAAGMTGAIRDRVEIHVRVATRVGHRRRICRKRRDRWQHHARKNCFARQRRRRLPGGNRVLRLPTHVCPRIGHLDVRQGNRLWTKRAGTLATAIASAPRPGARPTVTGPQRTNRGVVSAGAVRDPPDHCLILDSGSNRLRDCNVPVRAMMREIELAARANSFGFTSACASPPGGGPGRATKTSPERHRFRDTLTMRQCRRRPLRRAAIRPPDSALRHAVARAGGGREAFARLSEDGFDVGEPARRDAAPAVLAARLVRRDPGDAADG